MYVDVHGGLTFSDFCEEGDESTSICHIPEPGQPDRVWWFGFDCGHTYDYAPGMDAYLRRRKVGVAKSDTDREIESWAPYYTPSSLPNVVYRSLAYVKAECAKLAGQLAAKT